MSTDQTTDDHGLVAMSAQKIDADIGAMRGWYPIGVLPAYQNTDDADAALVLAAVRQCAASWVPEARLLGNVRAGDIVRATTEALRAMGSPIA